MNATIIESVRTASGGSLSLVAGLLLLAGLLAWLAAEILRTLARAAGERRWQGVALEKLRAQLRETKLRCREAEQAQAGWNGLRKFTVAPAVVQAAALALLLIAIRLVSSAGAAPFIYSKF